MLFDDISSDVSYVFTDEPHLSTDEKWRLLRDWQRFIHSGFKKLFFTEALYRFLQRECAFIAHYNRERFWRAFFAEELFKFRVFSNQFAGNRQSAEYGTPAWLEGNATDLKAAMCQEMTAIYEPICHILDDLERQHAEMIQAWHDFALAAGIEEMTLPPHYTLSANTRSLLAFAIQIALKKKQPLIGLQHQFPMPLLYPDADYAPVN